MNITRTIRFLILAILCFNSLHTLANEYRPRHSVPQYNKAHSKGFFIFSPFIVFGKFADGLSHIHMPNFGKLFENIDFSSGAHIVQEHKVMLSAAGAVIALSLWVKQLQKSETCGKWLGEKYAQVSTSVDDCATQCIQGCPLPVQLAFTPIKIVMQFLCNAIKKCIAMNSKNIAFFVVAPVAGKVLDGVCVCPIPLLNFTSIGSMASGAILTKGYFDQNFEKIDERLDGINTHITQVDEKNVAQHTVTQEKIGVAQSTIDVMGQNITKLFSKIKKLDTTVGQVKEQVGNVSGQVTSVFQELMGIKEQVTLLNGKIDSRDKKAVEQYEKLTKRLASLETLLHQKTERDEKLMLELQTFKGTYQEDHKTLRNELGLTATQLSNQISDVKKEVQRGFALPHQALPHNERAKDIKIQVLQLELGHQLANNS